MFSFEVFTQLQPIYYVTTFIITLNLIYFIIKKENKHRGIIVVNSFFLTIINALLLFFSGIIVDELNANGDMIAFILTIVSGVIFIVNFILHINYKRTLAAG